MTDYSQNISAVMGLPFTIVYSAAVFLVAGSRFTVGTLTLFLQLLNKITVPF